VFLLRDSHHHAHFSNNARCDARTLTAHLRHGHIMCQSGVLREAVLTARLRCTRPVVEEAGWPPGIGATPHGEVTLQKLQLKCLRLKHQQQARRILSSNGIPNSAQACLYLKTTQGKVSKPDRGMYGPSGSSDLTSSLKQSYLAPAFFSGRRRAPRHAPFHEHHL
jgi:hypothetical protein